MSDIPPLTAPGGDTAVAELPDEATLDANPWVTIVWDDPVNLMSYVTHVFCSYFHYSRERAERLMMQVHMEGKAVVSSGMREAMERDVNAMQGFGLWATVGRAQ
ncbi:ATP-dependent Clp protease adapter ClpS [Propionibacterium cyclohexanicum]|nr:ATP-dependent Clp protease adapter ClpS [Propionibacterium cyclohexanicum]